MMFCYIYGAGYVGRIARLDLESKGMYKVSGFIDDNRAGENIDGLRVISMQEYLTFYKTSSKIIIASNNHRDALINNLKKHNLSNYDVFKYRTNFEYKAIFSKYKQKLYNFILPILLFPLFCILKFISFFVKIKFINLHLNSFGNSTFMIDAYLARRKYEKCIYLFYSSYENGNDANTYFVKYIQDNLVSFILRNDLLIRILKDANAKFAFFYVDAHSYTVVPNHFPQFEKPIIEFANDEKVAMGLDLEANGLQKEFFCFHVRDRLFRSDSNDCFYSFRNTSLEKSCEAASRLALKINLQAIRSGAVAVERVEEKYKNIFDYPFSTLRSEKMDFYIASKMKFMIVGGTGANFLACAMRKPIAGVNLIHYGILFWTFMHIGSVVVPQKIRYTKTGRYLGLKEYLYIFGDEYEYRNNGEQFKELGLEFEENSVDEIYETALELNLRLDGVWVDSPEDIKNQEKFWAIQAANKNVLTENEFKLWFERTELGNVVEIARDKLNIRISSYFLRKNPWFLED